jgi:predicted nucleotidyltransferase
MTNKDDMAEVPDKILKIVDSFVKNAKENNISIEQAVLFGSYAKGIQSEWSDIDLAVVSSDFEGIRLRDNMKLSKTRTKTSFDLETHPFRPEDFTPDNLFVKEILSYGIRVI